VASDKFVGGKEGLRYDGMEWRNGMCNVPGVDVAWKSALESGCLSE
jgi:hypothetical protein